jgi:hypothetical protein
MLRVAKMRATQYLAEERRHHSLTQVASKAHDFVYKADRTCKLAELRRAKHSNALRANLEDRLASAQVKRDHMFTSGVIMAGGGPSPVKVAVTSMVTQTSSAPVSPAAKPEPSPSPSSARGSLRGGGSARAVRGVSRSAQTAPVSARGVRRSAQSAPMAGSVFRPPSPYLRGTAAADRFSSPSSVWWSNGSFAPDDFTLVCN